MSVAERLVEIREKSGYTRKKLADELGRPYRTITKYETGEREPGHSYIVEIAKKFGVSTDYILGVSDVMTLETKKSPSAAEATPGAELQQEIIRLAGNLSPELQDLFLAILRLIAARNQGLPVADLVSAGEAALKAESQNPTR